MQPVAVVFCYLNLFSLTKVSFDYNSWKNQFKKELLEAISSNKLKSEVIIEINDTNLIEVSLEKSIFNTFDDNNRLAIELKLYSDDQNNNTIKKNLYLIKPIILKMIESINETIKNYVNSAKIPTIDFVFSNKKFYTQPNTKNDFKIVQIIAADLHYLYGSDELIHVI